MTTNLLIGYADIPNAATTTTVSRTEDSTYPLSNLFGGNKTDTFNISAAATGDTTVTFSLPSGTTKSSNFIYIARADLLKNDDVATITIKGNSSNNYATATTVQTISSFGSQTLYGPNNDDYILKFTTSTAYRYWFVNYNSTASSLFAHSKLFIGTCFDIGRDPNAPATITRIKQGGAQVRPTYSFEFSWEGVSYQKAVQMYLNFYRTRRYVPLVIFTDSWHDILMGNRVIFCRLTEMQMPPRVTDYCDITATFEEMP